MQVNQKLGLINTPIMKAEYKIDKQFVFYFIVGKMCCIARHSNKKGLFFLLSL